MSARILVHPEDLRRAAELLRSEKKTVGLVPTMGALHEGHLTLIRHAKRLADEVIVTVFVNPTQFGPNEDFDAYPRDLARDVDLAASAGASLVFAPKTEEMYPKPDRTRVVVSKLSEGLCGASRPGHFDGVTTIVSKLFSIVGPATAVFGRKDYQQFRIIAQMTRDLFLPTTVVSHSTVREADGLALSSRNAYLSLDDRKRALSIPRALAAAAHAFEAGERTPSVLLEMVRGGLDRAGLRVDYVELRDSETLEVLEPGAREDGSREATWDHGLLAVAAFAGKTRLIDNLVLGEDAAPIVPFPSQPPSSRGFVQQGSK